MENILEVTDLEASPNNEFFILPSYYDLRLLVTIDEEFPLEKQLKNKELFDDCMEEFRKNYAEEDSEEEEQTYYLANNFDHLMDLFDYIVVRVNECDTKEYIMNNLIKYNKKIVLPVSLHIYDYDRLMELMDEYKDIIDLVYVTFDGNNKFVSLIECYKTMQAIKEQADEIKKLGLSPMEQVMYVYDKVRNRIYKAEDKDDSMEKSRDLTEVMFGDKIVCAGYANIFKAFLSSLGINNKMVYLKQRRNETEGHARNIAYIVDPKYDIDGVYYFDTTWDSKRENETNEYLYRYNYFAKTKKYMDIVERRAYEDEQFFVFTKNLWKHASDALGKEDYDTLNQCVRSINYMAEMVNEEKITYSALVDILMYNNQEINDTVIEKIKELEEKVSEKFNKELFAETLIKLLNNVRKVEYLENPEWYPYSKEDIKKTHEISEWEFKKEDEDLRNRLYATIFGANIELEDDIDDYFEEYMSQNKLTKEIEKVKKKTI